MSNKLKIIIVCSVIAFLGVIIFFSTGQKEQEQRYAEYLPADTLMTVSFTNINTMVDKFGASSLGHLMSKESMAQIFSELNMSHEIDTYNQTVDDLVAVFENPAFKAVFGDDTTFAFLRPDANKLLENTPQEIERSMVAFATTAASGAIDMFAKLLASESVSKENVGGVSLTKVQVDADTEVYAAADSGFLILSFNPETIANLIHAHDAKPRLVDSTAFTDAEKAMEVRAEHTVYGKSFLNIKVLKEILDESESEQAREYGEFLGGIAWLNSITTEKGKELYVDSKLSFEYESLHPMVKSSITAQAETNDTLHLIGEQCLAYEWASTLSPEFINFSMTEKEQQQANKLLVDEVGFSIEELFEIIGPQYGFVVNDIVNTGFLPIPKVMVFIQIRDYAGGEKLLDGLRARINEAGLASERKLEQGDKTIYYWSVLPGEATQLALVLTPNMLYAANGKTTLANILNKGVDSNLNENVAGKLGAELQAELEEARLGSAIIYPERLAHKLQPIAEWIFTTVAATQGVSVSKLGRSLLDVMRSCEVILVTSSLSNYGGEWKTILRMKDDLQKQ